jgi:hypothetical protein
MSNYQPGTRIKDVTTGWAGTVQEIPTNGAGTPMNEWQPLPPGFPPNYNDGLILVQWDMQGGGGVLPFTVFVANSSVIAL